MDQPDVGLGQGCGRGRGYILKQAIEDATSTSRVKSETNTGEMSKIQEPNQSTVSDEEIKNWLKKELTGRKGGIWTKHLPGFFSKFFHASAPDDFIRKIQSWSQMFQIDSITGGEIIRLSREVHVEQGGNTEESIPNVETVPDKYIQIWLKKELSKSNSGILMTDIPRLFKENFNAPAPEDLITKTRSWTNMVQIESIHGREIMTSTSRISPTRHPKKPQDEDTQAMKESTSDNKTVSKAVCIPEEGSFLDVHVKWPESPTDFCESIPNVETVPDKYIQIWLKKELSKSNSGILMTDIPRLFKENFNAPAPEDLITKTRSWTNMVQIESIHGREVMTSTSRISPTRHPKKPQDEDTQAMKESTSDNKTVSKAVCIPEEGSFLDVHVKWPESPTDFCESIPNVETVPDKYIQIWLKKELSKSNSGILMTDIPRLFKENFNAPAPEDLITKTRSWTNMVQIESIHGREVMTSTSRISPTRHPKKPQDEDTQAMKESTSDNKTVSKAVCIPEEGSFLDVHVKWPESPTDFCCILYKHHPELESMMEELNACLAAKSETMLNTALVPDDVYAGNYRGTWYRVIFKGYSEDNMVMTYLADSCSVVKLNMDQLQELPNKFKSLPVGSFKARLHGVAPAEGSNQWSEQARKAFSIITTERDFVCLICDRADDNGVVSVRLVDTSTEDDVVVDEVLEERDDVVRTP